MEFWPFGLEAYGWPVASFLDALEHLGREVFVLDEAAGCLWRSSADALAEAASGDLRPQNRAFRNVVLLPYGLASSPEIQPLIR